MAGKLIETVSGLGGCMLEAGTWLRGTRTVKTQIEVIFGFADGKLANDYDITAHTKDVNINGT